MSIIKVTNLTYEYEGSSDLIFDEASFSIDTDWKLGFIGRNGKGKTTFLKLLMGEYEYKGKIESSTYFDYFPYIISDEDQKKCATEFIENYKPGALEWRIIVELEKLDETAEILYRPFHTLSPGEQTKLLLAILFAGENEFLLIDEPTNHLDQRARKCVENYLHLKKGFILVSHDRQLLDGCIDHVLVLNRQTIEVQSGTFSSWWENKEKKDQFAKASNEKHMKEIGKLRKAAARTSQWADQNERTKIGFDPIKEHDRCLSTRSYIGAKTKKMQSRVKQMEHRLENEIMQKEGLLVDLEKTIDLKLMPLEHHKKRLVLLQNYSLGYADTQTPLFEHLSLEIEKGDRIVLHGSNGCGKSTLIKRILEIAVEDANRNSQEACRLDKLPIWENGVLELASGLVISYVSQDTSMLHGSISDYCQEKQIEESLFCSILRQLDFERTQFTKNMEDYSQGQKKKVLLAASLLSRAHLYIWDEPLNYIDVFSRMQLEKLILTYQPTILFVEHDRSFREKIATKEIKFI